MLGWALMWVVAMGIERDRSEKQEENIKHSKECLDWMRCLRAETE